MRSRASVEKRLSVSGPSIFLHFVDLFPVVFVIGVYIVFSQRVIEIEDGAFGAVLVAHAAFRRQERNHHCVLVYIGDA